MLGGNLDNKKHRFDGLAEFISRRARVKLVELLRLHGMSTAEIAEAVGVTARSVRYWLDPRKTHPSNRHLNRLVEVAFEADSACTFKILAADAEEFQQLVNGHRINLTVELRDEVRAAQG